MLKRLFPKEFDNSYGGHWLGIALFAIVVSVRAIQGVNSIVMTRSVMVGADGIRLDTFNPVAADTAIALFALLGLHLSLIPLMSIAALVRYRSMIPFIYLLLD